MSSLSPTALSEAPSLAIIPPPQGVSVNPKGFADLDDPQFDIPVFDFATLTSGTPEERSRLVLDLGQVCRNWGFFMLTNHGVPESLTNRMMGAFYRFFQQPEEIKRRGTGENGCLDPVVYEMTYMTGPGNIKLWREFYMVAVQPEFHLDNNTVEFSEASKEFGMRIMEVEMKLIEAVSESLGFEGNYIHKTLNLDDPHQSVAGNYYPPCPEPDLAIGLKPHTDASLVTLLVENGILGLEVEHNGKWVKVESKIPNALWVMVGDHLQIFTNGKYKSVIHRACVNNQSTRMSIAIPYGPSVDNVVAPSPELLKNEGERPFYEAMTFTEYIKIKRSRGVVNTIV